jgi:ER-bound oxygenase mpaB/B'/Rubber oxygenase, catalytic domain
MQVQFLRIIRYLFMEYFVDKHSIVRQIWGKSDTILFIFGGAAAEFALNKAVDWLYFTGKLPADPLGRLLSTVSYARSIIFSTKEAANAAIDKISAIHAAVQNSRQQTIPDWAYRDVLFMLIHYSIAAFELLERQLSDSEKEEVHNVFYRVGTRMGLIDLPESYKSWLKKRDEHLQQNLAKSKYSIDLYRQYKKHLGFFRYQLLLQAQSLVAPPIVKELLGLKSTSIVIPFLTMYKLSRQIKLDRLVKILLLPNKYKMEIMALDVIKINM